MSFSINRWTGYGNLGRDADIKFTANGTQVANFSVATSHGKKKPDGTWENLTDWTNCVLWKNEKTAAQLLKGTRVYVEGRLSTRSYEDKDGKKIYATEVICDSVIPANGNTGSSAGNGGDDLPF